jgi:hypothetical protein
LTSAKSIVDISATVEMTTMGEQFNIALANMTVAIVYTYTIAYVLVPRLSRRKFLLFGVGVIFLTLIAELILLYGLGIRMDSPREEVILAVWFQGLHLVNDGAPVFCGLFVTIKMVKTWYIKQDEEMALIRENSNAELQLLKAQVHPHFLFNTLNNIYSFALNHSPKAPELVLKLSTMVRYMVYECKASHVSLEKELKMIGDYIGLEKVRYGNRLDIDVNISGDPDRQLIAPLLLIPFIENCFKHGTSRMISKSWISITVVIRTGKLYFCAINVKPEHPPVVDGRKGIGLANVTKRLQLLYPDRHTLLIEPAKDSFRIEMEVPLHPAPEPVTSDHLSLKTSDVEYVGA